MINFLIRIIEPLSSRCVKFRFKPISEDAQLARLKYISVAQEITYDEDVIYIDLLRYLIDWLTGFKKINPNIGRGFEKEY